MLDCAATSADMVLFPVPGAPVMITIRPCSIYLSILSKKVRREKFPPDFSAKEALGGVSFTDSAAGTFF
jgi:hypothetical protein